MTKMETDTTTSLEIGPDEKKLYDDEVGDSLDLDFLLK